MVGVWYAESTGHKGATFVHDLGQGVRERKGEGEGERRIGGEGRREEWGGTGEVEGRGRWGVGNAAREFY